MKLAFSLHNAVEQRNKKALIILHGLFGSSRNWGTTGATIAQRCNMPVYCVDQRNHGRTFQNEGNGPMNWEAMCSDLVAFIGGLPHERVSLMGHSLGGQVIMQAGRRGLLPLDKVDMQVIVDVAPKPVQFIGGHTAKLLDRMISLEEARLRTRQEASEFLAYIEPDNKVVQFLLSNGAVDKTTETFQFRLPLKELKTGMTRLQETYNETPQKQMITFPTLFIKGARSDYVMMPEDWVLIEKNFKNACMKELEGSGHWPHFDEPEAFTSLVTRFLQSEEPIS